MQRLKLVLAMDMPPTLTIRMVDPVTLTEVFKDYLDMAMDMDTMDYTRERLMPAMDMASTLLCPTMLMEESAMRQGAHRDSKFTTMARGRLMPSRSMAMDMLVLPLSCMNPALPTPMGTVSATSARGLLMPSPTTAMEATATEATAPASSMCPHHSLDMELVFIMVRVSRMDRFAIRLFMLTFQQ